MKADKASATSTSINNVTSFTENKLTPAFKDQVALSMILSPPGPENSTLAQYSSCYKSFKTTEKPSPTYSEQISSTNIAKKSIDMNKNYNTNEIVTSNKHRGK